MTPIPHLLNPFVAVVIREVGCVSARIDISSYSAAQGFTLIPECVNALHYVDADFDESLE
jgi:hypothetical protein